MQTTRPLPIRLYLRLKQTNAPFMVVLAVIVGLLGGVGAVGFRELIHTIQHFAWASDPYSLDDVRALPWWWILMVPAIGGLAVGFVTIFASEARGHGVPEIISAVAVGGGRIRARVAAIKALASALSIATGGSVGREGPIAQIGAAIGSTLGQVLQLNPRRLRTLVGCGVAAGIAATFNAPVAGALFAVEVIVGDFGVPQFSPIVISSVMATVVARGFYGEAEAFVVPEYQLNTPLELFGYAALGVAAAFVAFVFVRALDASETIGEQSKLSAPVKACLGGAAVGVLALWFPGVLGVGYEAMGSALTGQVGVGMLMVLLVVKILAVCLTLGSGGSGGVFAPSLFLGATLGGAVGYVMEWLLPGQAAPVGAYALVGMGALLAATSHAPVTAIVMLFELTGDYRIILPLMLSCILGTLLATHLLGDSIYTIRLARRGVRVRAGRDANLLAAIPVTEVMRTDIARVAPGTPLTELMRLFVAEERLNLYVVDDKGSFHGIISAQDLRPVFSDAESLADVLVAEDIADSDVRTVGPGERLDDVLETLSAGFRDALPVVERGQLLGSVATDAVLRRYRTELLRREMATGLARGLDPEEGDGPVRRVGEYVVAEIDAPAALWHTSLAAAHLRERLGVNVLLIKPGGEGSDAPPSLPEAGTEIRPGDRLVIFGREDDVRTLQNEG